MVKFEDIKVGSQILPLVKHVTKRQLFMYSASTWDFHPGHYDTAFAQRQGFRDIYVDGPMTAAFMAQIITDWIGLNGNLKKLSLTYRNMAFVGDTLTCISKVTEKYIKDGVNMLECEILLENQEKKAVAQGKATVALT